MLTDHVDLLGMKGLEVTHRSFDHHSYYYVYKLSQLGLGFAWLETLRTDSPTSGTFMEALTARGINSKPLREKLQARRQV